MKLERLFKRTKTGATQICDISIDGDTFKVVFGQLNGKMQEKSTQCFPKNIGRANETSGHEQAVAEAKAKWAKKVKAGYSVNDEAPVTVQLPQKVKAYVGNEDKIEFPAYSTNKYNGLNATYWLLEDGSLRLTSRGGDEYPEIPHLEKSIKTMMAIANTTCLNGELYIHGEHLQDITSAVKKPKELSKKLQFYTFELPLVEGTYESKVKTLKAIPNALVPTKVGSAEDIETCYATAMAKGFEGTVLYNANAEYKFNERSSSVYKYKKAVEGEFRVIDYILDKNGHAVYTCEAGSETFKVKRKGTNEERDADATNATQNIGSWLTIEYEMLSKSGKPLKPVGLQFRDCSDDGTPLA